jgi:hypothetical protein
MKLAIRTEPSLPDNRFGDIVVWDRLQHITVDF